MWCYNGYSRNYKIVDDIPLYPALTLILKGHNRFFEEKLEGTNVIPSELQYLIRLSVDGDISQGIV
jgi:hypothetical protein